MHLDKNNPKIKGRLRQISNSKRRSVELDEYPIEILETVLKILEEQEG